jgi:hypothetical protein
MISSGDKEYLETKAIKKGLKQLESPFSDLAERIKAEFGVRPLNIMYDILPHNKQPRLQIIFEWHKDTIAFKSENGLFFDTTKQESVTNTVNDLIQKYPDYSADNLLVIFNAFEPIAREEANRNISNEKLEKLKEDMNSGDIWQIKRSFSTGIFFFYTEEQLKKNDNDLTKNKFKTAYLKLLKESDEFGYIYEANFSIKLDSKENFDKNYQSNWFYYYKDN